MRNTKPKLELVVDHVPVGPSEAFIRRRFNPNEPHSPVRFEPTTKGENDVVI